MYDLQRAGGFKRFSAFLFDFIILSILAVGFAFAISAITGYDARLGDYEAKVKEYEAAYGVDFDISQEEYDALEGEALDNFKAAEKAFGTDPEVSGIYTVIFNLTLLTVSLSLFLAYFVAEFVIPLILGNGQTVGKKIFAVGVMFNNSVKLNSLGLFVRSVLGKYTVETMVPVLILMMVVFFGAGYIGLIALVLIPVLEMVLFFASHNRTLIHDALSGTVAVDMASQMIFDSYDEMMAYKNRVHRENVDTTGY